MNKTAFKTAVCLFALSVIPFLITVNTARKTPRYKNTVIAVLPKNADTGFLSADALDKLLDAYPLTYEKTYIAAAKAARTGKTVNVIATNYARMFFISGCQSAPYEEPNTKIINGRFFTGGEQKNSEKAATLNKKAAFEIFGSFEISGLPFYLNGTPYVVTGVIDDANADKPNVYVPAKTWGGAAANALMVSANTQNAEIIKSDLQSLAGVNPNLFDIINLSLYRAIIADKPYLSAYTALLGLSVIAFKICFAFFRHILAGFAEINKNSYNSVPQSETVSLGLKRENISVFIKTLLCAALFIAATVIFLSALTRVTEKLLVAQSAAGISSDISKTCFNGELASLYKAYANSNMSFAAFCAALLGGVIAALFV